MEDFSTYRVFNCIRILTHSKMGSEALDTATAYLNTTPSLGFHCTCIYSNSLGDSDLSEVGQL